MMHACCRPCWVRGCCVSRRRRAARGHTYTLLGGRACGKARKQCPAVASCCYCCVVGRNIMCNVILAARDLVKGEEWSVSRIRERLGPQLCWWDAAENFEREDNRRTEWRCYPQINLICPKKKKQGDRERKERTLCDLLHFHCYCYRSLLRGDRTRKRPRARTGSLATGLSCYRSTLSIYAHKALT